MSLYGYLHDFNELPYSFLWHENYWLLMITTPHPTCGRGAPSRPGCATPIWCATRTHKYVRRTLMDPEAAFPLSLQAP